MGNFQSSDKFINLKTKPNGFTIPKNFVHFQKDQKLSWLCGGAFPASYELLYFLKEFEVKTIVTLLLEPVKLGWNINHNKGNYLWFEENPLIKEFNWIPITMVDEGIPSIEDLKKLVALSKKDKIYVHCWDGDNRTRFILRFLMMQEGLSLEETDFYLKLGDITINQRKFLLNEEVKEIPENKILTPPDHECYLINLHQNLLLFRSKNNLSIDQTICYFKLTPNYYTRKIFSKNGPKENLRCLAGRKIIDKLINLGPFWTEKVEMDQVTLEEKWKDYLIDSSFIRKKMGLIQLEADFSKKPPSVTFFVKINSWLFKVFEDHDFDSVILTVSSMPDWILKDWECPEIVLMR